MKIKRLTATSQIPTRATVDSAGYDLFADIAEPIVIAPQQIVKIPTGVAIALPQNTVGLIYGRSGLGVKHGIAPANAVGVIDADYRGELIVGLINHSTTPYTIQPQDRIAQLVVTPILTPELQEVDELDSTVRGAGGFGSSGSN